MNSGPASATKNDFDPQAPLVGSDGLEYEDFAAFILGRPLDSWRNTYIRQARTHNQPESAIRTWFEAWDNGQPDEKIVTKHVRANFAVSRTGRGLCNETVDHGGAP